MTATDPSKIVLHADRTITVTLEQGRTVVLRPPTIGEFRVIRDQYKAADDAFKSSIADALAAKAGAENTDLLLLDTDAAMVGETESPYATAFASVLEVLGGCQPIAADTLPLWSGRGGMYGLMANHWRNVEVVPVNEAAAPPPVEAPRPYFDSPEPQAPEVLYPDALPPPPPVQADGMTPGPVPAQV